MKRKFTFDRFTLYERGQYRPVVMEVIGGVATLRLKGLRRKVVIDPAAAYQRQIKAEVEAERKAKRGRRAR